MKEALFRLRVIEQSTSFLSTLKLLRSIYHLVGDAPLPDALLKKPVHKEQWHQLTLGFFDIGLSSPAGTLERIVLEEMGARTPGITTKISLHISLAFFSSTLILVVPAYLMCP